MIGWQCTAAQRFVDGICEAVLSAALARLADRFSFRVFPTFFVLAFWLSLFAMIRCPFFTPARMLVAVGNR